MANIFILRLDNRSVSTGIKAEQLALMQIEKQSRAARVGAFGEHFCLPSGEKVLLSESYASGIEMQMVTQKNSVEIWRTKFGYGKRD